MIKIIVDDSLTIENCKEKGFEYQEDIIYALEAPGLVNNEIADLIAKGYVLGEPANYNLKQNNFVGLYKSIRSI